MDAAKLNEHPNEAAGSKRAVIYARVATQGPLKDQGLSTQIEACRQYAASHSLEVTEDHIVTDVYSGAKINRPGLDQVRALTDGQEVGVVIIYRPDRLSRDQSQLLLLYEEWQRAGIELHFVSC